MTRYLINPSDMDDKDPNEREKAAQKKQKLCEDKKTLKNRSTNPLSAKRKRGTRETTPPKGCY